MNIIKNYLFARTICKKYGYKLKLHLDAGSAWAVFNEYTGVREIHISLFDRYFKQTFLHELSHLRSFTRMENRGQSSCDAMENPILRFTEESRAWLFAKRILKGEYDSEESKDCLLSYSHWHYHKQVKPMMVSEYTDNFVKCMRRV
tara:strand:- start:75960 stop:76397 length:438 start_codon:yes stop_codon:yes gene_type:complete